MLGKPDSPEFPNSLRLLLHFWIDNEDLDVADDDKLPEKENGSEEDKDVKEKESEPNKRERKKGSLEQKNNSFYFVSTVNVLSYSPDPPTLFVCINPCGQSKRPRIIQN